eukprot:7076084-Alexandrium_andersonii.AAC.1
MFRALELSCEASVLVFLTSPALPLAMSPPRSWACSAVTHLSWETGYPLDRSDASSAPSCP